MVGAISTFGIQIVQQAGGAALVGVFADVPRFLGLTDITAFIQANNFVVGFQVAVRAHHICQYLLRGLQFQFLRLGDGVFRARNLSLVAVENRQVNIEVKCAAALPVGVCVIEGHIQIALAVGLRQGFLASGRDHALLRGLQVRPRAQRQCFQIVDAGLDRRIGQLAVHVIIIRHRFKSQILPQRGERLHLRETRRGKIALKLQ